MNIKSIIRIFFEVTLSIILLIGCTNSSVNNYKCNCLPADDGERDDMKYDNEYVKFHDSRGNFEVSLTYKSKDSVYTNYHYQLCHLTGTEGHGMADLSTIAKVNCKKREIEFYPSKEFKSSSYGTYIENVFSWRVVGKYKIDKKGNLHALNAYGNKLKTLKHIESY